MENEQYLFPRYSGPLHSYCVCGQRRFMHVCAHARAKAQNHQSLCCLHTKSMDVDEGLDKKFRPLALLSIPEYQFIRDVLRICDEYRNLVCCLQFCVHDPRRKRHFNTYKNINNKTPQYCQNPRPNLRSLELIFPYKPSVLFVGHRQTVQTMIRRRRTRRLSDQGLYCLLTECSIEI